jgi:hypothetical protein
MKTMEAFQANPSKAPASLWKTEHPLITKAVHADADRGKHFLKISDDRLF